MATSNTQSPENSGNRSIRAHLDAEHGLLQALIECNRKERARVEREMPLIGCLSPETLSCIFKFAAALPCNRASEPPSSFIVSQVSKRWRSVAINDASLWTKLDIFPQTSFEIIQFYLSRSRQRLLDVIVYLSPLHSPAAAVPKGLQDLFAAILPASDRWRNLVVLAPDAYILSHAEGCLVGVTAPKLISLQLSSFSNRRMCFEPQFPNLFASSTSLRKLTLRRECLSEKIVAAGHIITLHLASLVVRDYEQLRNVLSCCTVLERLILEIEFQDPPASPFDDLYHGTIAMPSLHALHLRGAPCLHLFDTPRLHTLHLSYSSPVSAAHIPTSLPILNPTIAQREQLAQTLGVLGAYRFRGIRHLSVNGPYVEVMLASLALTEKKAGKPGADTRPYWPKLETISLPTYRPGTPGPIWAFMSARFAANGIRLPKIRLPTALAADPLAEWLEENNCLELYDNDSISLPEAYIVGLGDVVRG